MSEQWRPIARYPNYEISDRGRVRSIKRVAPQLNRWGTTTNRPIRERILRLGHRSGYPLASLHVGDEQVTVYVHQEVMRAFGSPSPFEGAFVCHLDDVRDNNNINNLAWGTQYENIIDAKMNGKVFGGHRPKGSKMDSTTKRNNFVWSYSSLRNYEQCPHRYWHYDILHDIKEAESLPLVEGKRVHDAFRAHVAEGVSLPTGLTMFAPVLRKLAAAKGEVSTEQKLALTEGLKPTAFFGPGVWFRTVLDYLNVRDNTSLVIDYKTGKPRDGEDLQLELAACVVFAYQPAIEKVKAGFLYTQTESITQYEYTRSDAMRIWEKVLPRVNRMLQAQIDNDYQPKPGFLCKKWCAVTSCKYNGV